MGDTGIFECDGYRIFYEKVGHGPCVVFMFPGAIGNARADFGAQFDGLDKEKFTLIGWDSPGTGYSRPPERDYKEHGDKKLYYEYDAEVSVKLMKHLGYESYSVMGWSDGGKSAMLTAILFPAKIDKLVLWGTLAYLPQHHRKLWKTICTLEYWSQEKINKYIKIYGNRETLEKIFYTHMLYTETTTDICKDRVKNIQCPTLVMHGKNDTMIPREFFDHLVDNIPDCESYVFQNAVHDYHLTHAEQFNKLITRFLLD